MGFFFLDNSLQQWGTAAAVTAGAAALMYFVHVFLLRKVSAIAARTATRVDDILATILASTYTLFIVAVALYLGSLVLDLTPERALFARRAALCALLVQAAVWGDTGLRAWRDQYRVGVPGDAARRASSAVLCFVARLALWLIAVLMILDNLGFNITTLVASLGIGGIAVALAVQNILGDLFASLSIMLDKPFEIGDFIIVGDVLGTVEHIGLKTTRVRGLGGEQVVFSNGELLKSRIHNHKRMETRRVAFVLRVAYGTPEPQLQAIPGMVRDIVEAEPDVDFERAHFFRYSDWSLDFEVVYHFRSPDYFMHMDAQQRVLLALYRRFEREAIQFAHPLSVVRLADQQHPAPRPAVAPVPGSAFRH